MKELTKEEAVQMYESGKWKELTVEERAVVQLLALAKFGRKCFESHRDGLNDLDGDDLQKWALEFGLLKETKVFAPCNTDPDIGCWCQEYHGEFPCICIKSTDLAQLPEKK